ncbi:11300_t:CDS:2, partial [Paraglomus occultum]
VISKYIEEAKEIEMDAVASDGNLLIHVISEHIENAGVHSGDATLVLPPQDLDPETVSKIKSATEKIANELNVTGPFNIQFIAKNNDIKVIECNLRASRSFPFASKVMGIDLIEMATMAMLGMPAEPKQLNLPKDYVAVKVPQFSFSRLSGADPVLGVEMASTGEVACFGRDKYEAYLKALISTAFTLPKKNILLSIGSYKEKLEMLPSVTKLHSMGFKLFATSGTADFIQEHGIAVKYLDISKGAGHKPEYSLEQHLANNLIDLYINLPSKNRYRRVASFMSNGYRTRRMAVDYSVPLITNVKCAKLFIEALHRNPDLEVQSIDCKCSHETVTLPGPFNISAFVPHSAELGKNDFAEVTKASLAAGFTVINTLPIGLNESLRDAGTMAIAHTSSRGNGHCDYALSVAATEYNVEQITEVIPDVASLFIPFSSFVNAQSPKIATIAKHFSSWPVLSPVITDAKGNDLASVLLVASLHSRSIHVTGVSTKDDIEIIRLSKEKGLKVTCDVAVYALFLNTEDIDGCANVLPTPADQSALWKHLDVIDCFSVGTLPYRLSMELGRETCASVGIEETIPLLCNAVNEGKLSMEDIKKRLYTNPRKIFSIPEQINTYVEIEIDRKIKISDKPGRWSPFAGQTLFGAVTRVVLRGETAYLDNGFYSDGNVGCDISSKTYIFTKMSAAEEPVEAEQKPLAIGVNTQPPPKTTVTSAKVIPPSYGSGDIVPKTVAPDWILEPPVMPANLDPFLKNSPFYRKHILSVKEFTRNDLHLLFGVAHEMRTLVERYGSINLLQGRVLFTMFFEPSTRTSASFEAAMNRLGGRVVSVKVDSSSVAKGESLADTVRTLGSYGDLIVLRHPEPGSTKVAAEFSPVPIINAGDGVGEHPTQAFLDVYTIREELGTVNGLTVTLVGDLKNGRTVHSLVKILSLYHVTLNYVSPPSLRMPEDIRVSVDKQGTPQ